MENQLKNKVKKRLAIYGTMFLLGTTSLNLVGCKDQIVKEPTKIETVDENEKEELATSEISENEVTESDVVSENTAVEEPSPEKVNIEIKELSPLVPPILEDSLKYFNSLTDEEKIIYQLGYSCFLDNEKSENGIYETNFDISLYGEEYTKYKEYKKGDKTFMSLYNTGFCSAIENIEFTKGEIYTSITIDGDGWYDHSLKIANIDTLSIIKLNDDKMNRFYIIKDYQGEEVIEANTYTNFASGTLIDSEISDFTVTPVSTYLERMDARGDIPYDEYISDLWPSYFGDSEYLNQGKSK